jgi:hypothetical protein
MIAIILLVPRYTARMDPKRQRERLLRILAVGIGAAVPIAVVAAVFWYWTNYGPLSD